MEDHLDRDSRQLKRFQLRTPAIVKIAHPDLGTVAELHRRDICSGGTFLQTNHSLSSGASVEFTLFLLISAFHKGEDYRTR